MLTMLDTRYTTLTGAQATLPATAAAKFESRLEGRLLQPGDEGYDQARRVWNGWIP